MIRAAFLADPALIVQVYGPERRERLATLADVIPDVVPPSPIDDALNRLREVEVLFSTWSMPALTAGQLDRLPNLRAVFYAAGSVQGFARPLLQRGILVVSAWRANAVPVAEFTLAQILLACKGYFRNVREYRQPGMTHREAFRGPGCYGETVALLGTGAIGSLLAGMLQPFCLGVLAYDPFLDEERARELGVERVSLEAAFERAFVVSNHLPDKPETAALIDGRLLRRLRPGATFINTGRGRTVKAEDLVETLRARPDLTALLDVTDPEPLPPDSPLFGLPNVQVSTHIAGAIHDERRRLADTCIEEFERYLRGEPLRHAVSEEMLAGLASRLWPF
jgi:phosphoglycerate dehydrogenase-like enzyme